MCVKKTHFHRYHMVDNDLQTGVLPVPAPKRCREWAHSEHTLALPLPPLPTLHGQWLVIIAPHHGSCKAMGVYISLMPSQCLSPRRKMPPLHWVPSPRVAEMTMGSLHKRDDSLLEVRGFLPRIHLSHLKYKSYPEPGGQVLTAHLKHEHGFQNSLN